MPASTSRTLTVRPVRDPKVLDPVGYHLLDKPARDQVDSFVVAHGLEPKQTVTLQVRFGKVIATQVSVDAEGRLRLTPDRQDVVHVVRRVPVRTTVPSCIPRVAA